MGVYAQLFKETTLGCLEPSSNAFFLSIEFLANPTFSCLVG